MKKEKVHRLLEFHLKEMKYVKLIRKFKDKEELSSGFILGKSKDFILLQESDDFRILGYQILPIKYIHQVRYNKNDKTYEKILKAEGLLKQVKLAHKIDLTSWNSLCKDVKNTKFTIISECEKPKHQYFCIGNLKKVHKKSISIQYFNAQGILDKELTKHKFKNITKLSFDDHYANVFSKYLT